MTDPPSGPGMKRSLGSLQACAPSRARWTAGPPRAPSAPIPRRSSSTTSSGSTPAGAAPLGEAALRRDELADDVEHTLFDRHAAGRVLDQNDPDLEQLDGFNIQPSDSMWRYRHLIRGHLEGAALAAAGCVQRSSFSPHRGSRRRLMPA